MSSHTNLGNISLPVGSYKDSAGHDKKRWRTIGALMQTTEDDGTRRFWLRLHLDIFHASLYALIRSVVGVRGDDVVTAQIFEPRDRAKPDAKDPGAPADEDGPF